jgi:hypothetical protein
MNWLDLGIIVFLIIFLIIGIKKGLMSSVLSNFSFGINAVLSFFLCKPIASLYDKIFGISGAIANSYETKLLSASADFGTNLLSLGENELSNFVSTTIDKGGFSGLTKSLFKLFINNQSLYSKLHSAGIESRTLSDIISNSYASFFTTIIAFVTSVLLLYLIVWLFKLLVKKLRTIGFVRFVDNTLGAIYGIFRCFIILVIICLVIKLLSPFAFMQSVTSYINGSFFGKFIYSTINNFFDNYLNFNDVATAIFGS